MSPFRRLLTYLRPYRREFLLGLASVVGATGVSLTAPWVLKYAIDDLTTGVTRAKLAWYGSVLLGIGLVGGVFRFLMRRILVGISRHIEYDMRNDFFAQLERLPLAYFQTHRTGDLMSRATNDLNAVRQMVGPAVMYSSSTALGFIIALGLMISIDGRLTLVSLIPMPFVSLSVKYFAGAIHKRFEEIQAQLSDVSAIAQEALSGVRVVRAYRQEHAELDRFRRANIEYVRRNRRLIAIQGMFFPSMGFFLGLGSMLVLWLGSREVITGRITVGEFVAFNAYLTMLAWPMIAFGWVTNMIQRGMASWKRMLEVMDTAPAIKDAPAPLTNERTQREQRTQRAQIRGEIEFHDLVFAYNGTPVLNHVSARIEAGQTVAFVGLTGSGKSTLIGLLARLHDPPPGSVFVDGIDVRDMPLATLRAAIGFVPQEPFLFSDTLAANVAFGLDAIEGREGQEEREGQEGQAGQAGQAGQEGQAGQAGQAGQERLRPFRAEPPTRGARFGEPGAEGRPRRSSSDDARAEAGNPAPVRESSEDRQRRIEAAAAVARLDKDIADFPKGYETLVGERGITLSGGQKQRTAIARAIVIDPRILILDDALSAVDTYTEEEILSRLRQVMRQRTSIIVSHRISTVRDADRIFVLDQGRIVERGTHDELIERDGFYAELHKTQLLEEELEAS